MPRTSIRLFKNSVQNIAVGLSMDNPSCLSGRVSRLRVVVSDSRQFPPPPLLGEDSLDKDRVSTVHVYCIECLRVVVSTVHYSVRFVKYSKMVTKEKSVNEVVLVSLLLFELIAP